VLEAVACGRATVASHAVRACLGAAAGDAGPGVFTGAMDDRANVDAVCWFAAEAWPAVRQALPEAEFLIVGRNPAPAVRGLDEHDGVRVTG
jgi:hypothetical protein